jgi:hypothetical protein
MIDPSSYKIYYLSGSIASGSLIELDGVNNFTIQKQISFDNFTAVGGMQTPYSINSPQQIEISFDRSYMQKDPLIEFTGTNPIPYFYVYDTNRFYSIPNSYLMSYSSAFSVGDLPRISTRFMSFGEDISQVNILPNLSINKLSDTLDLPKLNSISISGLYNSNFKKDFNIFSFDYSLSMNRQPFYSVGSTAPTEVSLILPNRIDSSINFKLSKSALSVDLADYQKINNKIEFDIKISGTGSSFSFPFRNGRLIANEIKLASQNTAELNSKFEGFYGI